MWKSSAGLPRRHAALIQLVIIMKEPKGMTGVPRHFSFRRHTDKGDGG